MLNTPQDRIPGYDSSDNYLKCNFAEHLRMSALTLTESFQTEEGRAPGWSQAVLGEEVNSVVIWDLGGF